MTLEDSQYLRALCAFCKLLEMIPRSDSWRPFLHSTSVRLWAEALAGLDVIGWTGSMLPHLLALHAHLWNRSHRRHLLLLLPLRHLDQLWWPMLCWEGVAHARLLACHTAEARYSSLTSSDRKRWRIGKKKTFSSFFWITVFELINYFLLFFIEFDWVWSYTLVSSHGC